ncbi:hypothetical protein LTR37_000104 [Vermiconidia calcicola]|uniref:Uncharacterized protein n=1 Tax=Vermiconidia calcicola TaxID=1690605 RepID=A0ACC3NZH3_9PEZI|nr:hypothetical protein LTR37_000104 [Vermiconidia calcicola]
MPASPPVGRAQTIQQAKAAFKARGRPALTEREQKLLERSIELDRRASKAKEAEKKKAEAAKKRSEKERKDREERLKVQLGTQRRCDKFGYKSSQMHLGAFLGKSRMQQQEARSLDTGALAGLSDDDSFGDSGVDDETLLDALNGMPGLESEEHSTLRTDKELKSPSHITHQRQSAKKSHTATVPPMYLNTELDLFWNELDSSTQIARELSTSLPTERQQQQNMTPSHTASFGSDEFDLTAEDLEELQPSPAQQRIAEDRKLMPPPPLPVRNLSPAKTSMEEATILDYGFTMNELESFMDDDLQLTQANPVYSVIQQPKFRLSPPWIATMASPTPTNEYSDIIRLSEHFRLPFGYTLLPSTSPITVLHLSRDLTLSRGRICYEMWDSWEEKVSGYVVPSEVVAAARDYKDGVSTKHWSGLPIDRRNVLWYAHRLLKERFPRIPAIAALRIAEKAERIGWQDRKEELEGMVVEHVNVEYTSFTFRLQYFENQLGPPPTPWTFSANLGDFYDVQRQYRTELKIHEEEVVKIVEPRMREVLKSWLPTSVSSLELTKFWRTHHLLESGSAKMDSFYGAETLHGSTLRDFGGLETVANIVARVGAFA